MKQAQSRACFIFWQHVIIQQYMKTIKYKFLTYEELIISIDRLSRFKLPEDSYYRVFSSIILKCVIAPKYSKTDIEKLKAKELSEIVKLIWNSSVENIYGKEKKSKKINLLKYLAEFSFKNIDSKTQILIDTDLHITQLIKDIDYNSAPINLKFLYKNLEETEKKQILFNSINSGLMFPIRKLIIVEGITEEILLPVFAKKLKHDFCKEGIYILGAGGKSKSPSLYLKLKEKVKVPITLLFDNDAAEICEILKDNLDNKDKIVIISKGEFEDILSPNLIKRALNNEYEPATPVIIEDLRIHKKMCENLEEFYKTRHLGEFKKSKLSKIIAENIKYDTDITEEIKNIISNVI